MNPFACAPPLRVHDGAETPSTISLKQASTIAEIRTDRFLQLYPATNDAEAHEMGLAAARESQAELGHWNWAARLGCASTGTNRIRTRRSRRFQGTRRWSATQQIRRGVN